jgi:ribonucleoside-diphosphate reductase alpha chain
MEDLNYIKRTVTVTAESSSIPFPDIVRTWAWGENVQYRNARLIRALDTDFTFEVEICVGAPATPTLRDVSKLEIDFARDSKLTPFSIATLKDRYLLDGESSPQEAFARAAMAFADDEAHAARLYHYSSNLWFMFATPALSNPPKRIGWAAKWEDNFKPECFDPKVRGMPISCFLNAPQDSRGSLTNHYSETAWLASVGGGVGAYWGAIRSNGMSTSNGSASSGVIPFVGVVDRLVLAFAQGRTRRASYAAWMDISHPEIIEFMEIRKPTGGDSNRRSLNLHNGVVIPDAFMHIIDKCTKDPFYDDAWPLVDPHTKEITEYVSAKLLWQRLLELRMQTGEPYIMFSDTVNNALPQSQKDLGLRVYHSNLCSEITLPVNAFRTAVCCLSSLNLEHFDVWSKEPLFIEDLIRMLDNILEFFLNNASKISDEDRQELNALMREELQKEGFDNDQINKIINITAKQVKNDLRKALFSAYRERSVGLGAMGWHTLLQKKRIPFESPMAYSLNDRVFAHIKKEAHKATVKLAKERGACPDAGGEMRRNMHLLAIAPNASSSIICGGVSPGIEPNRANAFVQKTTSGSWIVFNPELEKELELLGLNTLEMRNKIISNKGSVADIEELPEYTRAVFKTFSEIDQRHIVAQAGRRQKEICQAQSLNLAFDPTSHVAYVHTVHLNAWKEGCKTLYYVRSESVRRADNSGVSSVKLNQPSLDSLKEEVCLACEG